ncbi:MAG TPA: glycogen-binding domain-containing protein [Gemmatimonadales bacterium]|jgi:hypothetical protein
MLVPVAILHAQLSLGLGVVNARYGQSPAATAAQIASRYDWLHGLDQGFAEGSLAQFSGGVWAAQLSAREGHARPAGFLGVIGSDGSIEANVLSGDIATGRLQEAVGAGRRFGMVLASLAFSGGVLRDTGGTFIPQLSGRAAITISGLTAKAQRYEGRSARYTDVELSAEARRLGLISASGGSGERFNANGENDWMWHVEIAAHPSSVLGVEFGAGRTPTSPEGFQVGNYAALGLRLTYVPRVPRPAISRTPSGTRVAFSLGSAREVSIAGDWNDWTPVAMSRGSDGLWTIVLPAMSGAHKFSLTVDGKAVVPRGVPRLPDGFGGEAGLLVIG